MKRQKYVPVCGHYTVAITAKNLHANNFLVCDKWNWKQWVNTGEDKDIKARKSNTHVTPAYIHRYNKTITGILFCCFALKSIGINTSDIPLRLRLTKVTVSVWTLTVLVWNTLLNSLGLFAECTAFWKQYKDIQYAGKCLNTFIRIWVSINIW